MDDIWRRIDRWLDANAPAVLTDLRPPASAEDLRTTNEKLGIELPDDVVRSYRVHDGQGGAAEPLIDEWAPLPLARVVDHWRMLGDLLDKGDFGDNEADPAGPVQPLWWGRRWVPLLHNESGDYACADLAPPPEGRVGQILVFRHAAPVRRVLAEGLMALLARFADDLEAGRYAVEDGAVVRAVE